MQIGYKLSAEAFGPEEIIRQAIRAEEVGFDFVEMSDHYHPWLDIQGYSSFTWTVLGAVAARTRTIGLATGVTCPTVRYHPAIIAQAAAVGSDPEPHVRAVQSYLDAGFDRLVLLNAGPDQDGFLDFFERELAGRLRPLTPAAPQTKERHLITADQGR